MADDNRAPLREGQLLYLTTKGRKSGEPRRVEVWFAYADGTVYLLGHAASHWHRNAAADSNVQVEASGGQWAARATVLGAGDVDVVMARFREKYGDAAVRQHYEGTERVAVRLDLG